MCGGYKHKYHKALYSEYIGKKSVNYDAQLYSIKQCEICGIFSEGYAELNHPKYRN
jgi:hypothetical protein